MSITPAASSRPTAEQPRFASILAARANHVRPSDLEVHLREHCQKLRVSEKLSGAHFVFPSESSLAVRAYYPSDMVTLEESSSSNDETDDIDGILHFSQQFRLSICIFVLSNDNMQQLDLIHSFTHRVQRVLETSSSNASTRVIVVNSTQQAIAAITSVADSVRPSSSTLKRAFFERQQHQRNLSTASAFGQWIQQQGVLAEDSIVLTRFLPNLTTIATSDLQEVPCDPTTKLLLRSLFHERDDDTTTAEQSHAKSSPHDDDFSILSPLYQGLTTGSNLSRDYGFGPLPQHTQQPTTMSQMTALPSHAPRVFLPPPPLPPSLPPPPSYSVPAFHSSSGGYLFPSMAAAASAPVHPYSMSTSTGHSHSIPHPYHHHHHPHPPSSYQQQRYM